MLRLTTLQSSPERWKRQMGVRMMSNGSIRDKFAALIAKGKQYIAGAKEVVNNGKLAIPIQQRMSRGEVVPLADAQMVYENRRDLRKLIPFALLAVLLPEAIPAVVYALPRSLPSTFESAEERDERYSKLIDKRTLLVNESADLRKRFQTTSDANATLASATHAEREHAERILDSLLAVPSFLPAFWRKHSRGNRLLELKMHDELLRKHIVDHDTATRDMLMHLCYQRALPSVDTVRDTSFYLSELRSWLTNTQGVQDAAGLQGPLLANVFRVRHLQNNSEKNEPLMQRMAPSHAMQNEEEKSNVPHVGQLDMRVGIVQNVKRHPDADRLYVEQVDVGEATPRTIVSGLVQWMSADELERRKVVVLCNLPVSSMRGVPSQGMLLCAVSPTAVEPIAVPDFAKPGDPVVSPLWLSEPQSPTKKMRKIWRAVAPSLRTNSDGVVEYKGTPLLVHDTPCQSSLCDSPIQ